MLKNVVCIVGDHPDADNVDHMKMVWSLCENLWGDIPDSFKPSSCETVKLSAYEVEQIRKRLLTEWLSDVSSHRVEKECKYLKYNKVNPIKPKQKSQTKTNCCNTRNKKGI